MRGTPQEKQAVLAVGELLAELLVQIASGTPAAVTNGGALRRLRERVGHLYSITPDGSRLERAAIAGRDYIERVFSQRVTLTRDALVEAFTPLAELSEEVTGEVIPLADYTAANAATLAKIAELPPNVFTKITCFLGAGASAESGIPTVAGLLEEIWKRAERLQAPALSRVKAWCDRHQIVNIEEIMTALLFASSLADNARMRELLRSALYAAPEPTSDEEEHRVRRYLGPEPRRADTTLTVRDVEAVQSFASSVDLFFSLLVGTMLGARPNPCHEAAAELAAASDGSSVSLATTNYDACLDTALLSRKVKTDYIIGPEASRQGRVPLVKIHGSINWHYCETCQRPYMAELDHIREAIQRNIPAPLTGVYTCGGTTRQLIVPPTSFKFQGYPPLLQLADAARELFEGCSLLVIIGYSFADPADYVPKMMLRGMALRQHQTYVVLVDTDPRVVKRFTQMIARTLTGYDTETHLLPLVGEAADVGAAAFRAILQRASACTAHAPDAQPPPTLAPQIPPRRDGRRKAR